MSYRSSVAFKIEMKSCSKIAAVEVLEVLKARLMLENISLAKDAYIELDEKTLILSFESVKWYGEFKEVQIIEQWYQDICNAVRDDHKDYNIDAESQLALGCEKNNYAVKNEKVIFEEIVGAQRIRLGEEYDDNYNHIVGELSSPMFISRLIDF